VTKRIALASLILVVVLVGATAGIAFAQNDSSATPTAQPNYNVASFSDNLSARIAKILGIDQNKLQSAIDQASKELEAAQLDAYLNQLIQEGKITSDQAKQYKDWLNSNPNSTADQQKKYQDWLNSQPNIQVPGLGLPGFGRGGHQGSGFGPVPGQ
jgi:hypothetical protein